MSRNDEIEAEVAFAALGGWEEAFAEALERYCEHCRALPDRELKRRPSVLLDFNCWVDPAGAARGHPMGGLSVQQAADYLAREVRRGSKDPYALLGSIARECER